MNDEQLVFLDNWIKAMKIELATIQDVPALLDFQRKAFGPLCEEVGPVLTWAYLEKEG